uniref:Uncharacterized protein n=1 Tax=Anguilla anguilla TaxID=7936 RepID=A0A0E9RG82_ANGAN
MQKNSDNHSYYLCVLTHYDHFPSPQKTLKSK